MSVWDLWNANNAKFVAYGIKSRKSGFGHILGCAFDISPMFAAANWNIALKLKLTFPVMLCSRKRGS